MIINSLNHEFWEIRYIAVDNYTRGIRNDFHKGKSGLK